MTKDASPTRKLYKQCRRKMVIIFRVEKREEKRRESKEERGVEGRGGEDRGGERSVERGEKRREKNGEWRKMVNGVELYGVKWCVCVV